MNRARSVRVVAGLLLTLAAVACGARGERVATSSDRVEEGGREAYVFVTDPEALAEVERTGHGLAEVLGGSGTTADAIFTSSAEYRSIHAWVTADIAFTTQAHEAAGRTPVGHGDSEGSGLQRFSYRTFNPDWLRSPDVHFELVTVASRLDRRGSASRRIACGGTRLVYRMAYNGRREASRLPLTLLLELGDAGGPDCQEVARRWVGPANLSGPALASFLEAGPLSGLGPLVAVELNYETVRWPSSLRDDFAGQDEYVLRVFQKKDGGGLEPSKLENTPDSAGIASDPDKRERLRQWIEVNAVAIERGAATVPSEFLTEAISSVATRGLARLGNRPFSQIFRPEELAGASATPRKLLRSLDTMTCNGCHQARSIVGFHVLGEERIPNDDTATFVNAVAVGVSPHVVDEIARRKADLVQFLASGAGPSPVPPVERRGPAKYGSRCGIHPDFGDWTCDAPGLRCLDTDGDEVGTCQPADGPGVGDVTELVKVTPSASPFSDSAADRTRLSCTGGASVGGRGNVRGVDAFPGGACLGICSEGERGQTVGPMAVCSDIPFGARFDQCFGFTPFADCMAETVLPTVLRACDRENPCREDYVCARVRGRPSHGRIEEGGGGGCVPPYALIQMEVDTHWIR